MMRGLLKVGILFFGVTLLSFEIANAQPEIGIRGGINFANIAGDVNDTESRTGLMFGPYVRVPIPDSPVLIQPEILYSQKGYESGNTTYKLDYIEIIPLIRYNIENIELPESISPHFYAGPYVGIKVKSPDVFGNFSRTFDVGPTIGFGIDIDAFNVGVRYRRGLINVVDTDGESSIKNSAFSIVAGIEFNKLNE